METTNIQEIKHNVNRNIQEEAPKLEELQEIAATSSAAIAEEKLMEEKDIKEIEHNVNEGLIKDMGLAERFFNLQQDILNTELSKNKRVDMGQGKAKFNYLPLNKIIENLAPIMKKYRLIYNFTINLYEGKDYLELAITDIDTEDAMSFKVQLVNSNRQNDLSQAQGSGLTYARRYLLEMALGLVGDVSLDPDENMNKVAKQNKQTFIPNPPNAAPDFAPPVQAPEGFEPMPQMPVIPAPEAPNNPKMTPITMAPATSNENLFEGLELTL